MSHDGSSSKSYIKHATEKARLDNLAFTTFPEDYLPYTSPTYQRKAPYLVWDHHNYDGGGGIFKSKRRKLRHCCCGTTALVSAIVLLIAAILAIVAVSVYLGVVTNLFRSPILSLSGRLRVLEGDVFEEALLNQTSYEFLAKAEYYKSLVESAFTSSSLAHAFVAARIVAFRPGSLLVFFRVHLDRRKLEEEDSHVMLTAKNVLLGQAMASPSSSFDNLVLDLPSIDIREYADEEWLMASDFYLDPEEAIGFNPEDNGEDIAKKPIATTHISTSEKSLNVIPSPKTNKPKVKSDTTTIQLENVPSPSPPPQKSSVEKTRISSPNKATGSIGYGYAEWKPIELPEAIQVASLSDPPPLPKKEIRVSLEFPPAASSNSRTQLKAAPRETFHSVNKPQSNVASSIMSSVSLFIRPSSKNKTDEAGVGMVRTVLLDEDDHPAPEAEKKSRINESPFATESKFRTGMASFRVLELAKDSHESPIETLSQLDNKPDLTNTDVSTENIPDLSEEIASKTSYTTTNPSPKTTKNEVTTEISQEATEISSTVLMKQATEFLLHHYKSEKNFTTTSSIPHTYSEAHDTIFSQDDSYSQGSGIREDASTSSEFSDFKASDETEHDIAVEATTQMNNESIFDEKESTVTDFDMLLSTIQLFDIGSSMTENAVDLSSPPWGSDDDSTISVTETEELFSSIQESTKDITDSEIQGTTTDQEQRDSTTDINSYEIKVNGDQSNTSEDGTNEPNSSIALTETTTHLTTASNENATLQQDHQRFRKIFRPLKEGGFNPNEINSKDDDDNVLLKDGLSSSLKVTLPMLVDRTLDDNHDGNDIKQLTTPLSPTTKADGVIDFNSSFVICLDTEMRCDNGECVPLDHRCNMRRDCSDSSDESHCSCADYLGVIGQSQKICDGVRDCWDLSDEENCPWCFPGQFLCPQSKFCVNMSQVCDGSNDCPYGTDERYCVKLSDNEQGAKSLSYFPEGYLMVRKNGLWGKLCFQDFGGALEPQSARLKLDELGRAVCNALTYREMKETSQARDGNENELSYYKIRDQTVDQGNQRSVTMFEPSICPSRNVVHVKCQSLECGLRPMAISFRRRIVGGQSTSSGSWPWQAALYKEGDFQCGAVLVSDSWLISAGHCFFSTQTAYWTARMGILRRGTELRSPPEQVRKISRIILHPEYVDKGFINDIALLKMEKPVRFSDYLRPLCLPSESEDVKMWNGQYCSVVGWGKLYEIGHTFPDSLQEVRLPVISTEECRKKILFLSMYHITDNMFCAGFAEGGRDACLGDSGGPLMCQRQDGRFVLLGVTSNGDGCGRPGRPGVYTAVTQYLKWIGQITNEENVESLPQNATKPCLGHRCELGRCVQHYKVCDGRFDCTDGSDEQGCPITSHV